MILKIKSGIGDISKEINGIGMKFSCIEGKCFYM